MALGITGTDHRRPAVGVAVRFFLCVNVCTSVVEQVDGRHLVLAGCVINGRGMSVCIPRLKQWRTTAILTIIGFDGKCLAFKLLAADTGCPGADELRMLGQNRSNSVCMVSVNGPKESV